MGVKSFVFLGMIGLGLSGCVAGTAIGLAGDVIEGGAKATVMTGKVAARTAGAVLPGGDDDEKDDSPAP